MSHLQEVLEAARQERAEARELRVVAAAEQKKAAEARLAEKREELIAWLGDLAADLVVSEGGLDGESITFSVHPAHWMKGSVSVRRLKSGVAWYFEMLGGGYSPFTDAGSPEFRQFLLDWEERYGEWLGENIAASRLRVAEPDAWETTDDAARIRAALEQLLRLAPERGLEWRALYAQTQERIVRLRAAEAEQAAERAAAVERYREAMAAWADESDAVREANAAKVAALREQVNTLWVVCDIEYAVVAEDDRLKGVDTRMATGIRNQAMSDTWMVLEKGAWKLWTFRHIVRESVPREIRPADDPYSELFRRRATPFAEHPVAYIAKDEATVRAVLDALPPLPEEPDWAEVSGGLPWGTDAGKAAGDAVFRVYGEAPTYK